MASKTTEQIVKRGDLVRFSVPLYSPHGEPTEVYHDRGFVASVTDAGFVVVDAISGDRTWCWETEVHHVNGRLVRLPLTHEDRPWNPQPIRS